MKPSDALYLAVRSLWWYRGRALTISLCLGLTLWLPVTVRLLLSQFRADIEARAESTPLVIGPRGSRIDLALHALYFHSIAAEQTKMEEAQYVNDTGLAIAMPVHIRYVTQAFGDVPGVPIVGATVEYFEFRRLQVQQGHGLAMLGDCLLGANVAKRTGLKPGDRILSAPRNAFNLAGDYPLKMNVSGVLLPSHSPDDDVVFVDLKTAWIIDGIGHGHQKVDQHTDNSLLLKSDDQNTLTANAAVLPYTEITKENVHTFHFHGRERDFPISAVVVNPASRRNQTLLLGRYITERSQEAQCVKPAEVVNELMNVVFRVEKLMTFSSLLSGLVTALLLSLVLILSIRLRAAELRTMFRLGCSRSAVTLLIGTEILLMVLCGLVLTTLLTVATRSAATEWLRSLLFAA
ncbi:MAG: hypothetical protein KDA81_17100 [Planctomycetaceae bacterium]|nr:hypothetical protein [Planctomycetaceae bacterium]